MKTLRELADLLPGAAVSEPIDPLLQIQGVTCDSRQVRPGTLFICLPGARTDGHQYAAQACQAGAVAIVAEQAVTVTPGVPVLRVAHSREAMQTLAPYFFDYPGRRLRLIGVTGTNGKTTLTYLLQSILQAAGFQVGVIGTIQTVIGERILPMKNTTPDVVELQTILAEMAAAGMDYVVMEVSSHALALNRIAGCEFDVGVFTNLTQDHLDFHHTLDDYLAAKARLFDLVSAPDAQKQGKASVVNADDPAGETIVRHSACRVITYGIEHAADVRATQAEIKASGARFVIAGLPVELALQLKITGLFNIYNVLAAVSAAVAEGVEVSVIKTALENFQSVPGRFELVDEGQDFSVIVDYAHTPDGLENVLKTAKQLTERRIIVVFGCGGDRDRSKRPIMGRLAMVYGDVVIVTSDNPRTEDPEAILSDVELGMRDSAFGEKSYEKIADRREAIARAIRLAEPEDIVVIAGKGHEDYQILPDRTIHFDDREVARDLIRELR